MLEFRILGPLEQERLALPVELKALKKPTLITKHKKALDKLKARADTAGLATSHPGMYAVLEGLDDCANGTRPATDVPGLVARDPAAIGHVGSIAAATSRSWTARAR